MGAAAERTEGTAEVLEQLRERIRKLQAAPRAYLATLRTGVAPFDALLPGRGLPLGSAVELCGEAASGRTSLALRAVAAAHRERRLCAYVDGPGQLYPPAAAAMGVDLERLLIVRPREVKQLVWTAVQLARSGAFACVVLDLTQTGARLALAEGKKLADAAFRGGSLLLLLTAPEAPGDGMLRVRTQAQGLSGLRVEVVRSRQGGMGAGALVPWEALYPALAAARGHVAAGMHPRELLGGGDQGFQRVRTSVERNGCGVMGGRPGRDRALPSLGAALGLGARH
ncbi:MAG: recombinase RecA [Myxococcaceae bacterium]|nr:recombinase RecA [Myxococcaceae bacterium]